MRFTECKIEWQGDTATIFDPVAHGCLNLDGKSPKARVSLYERKPETRDGVTRWDRPRIVDNMVNVTVEEQPTGALLLHGDSLRGEHAFGPGNGQVEVLVTPAKGCKGCS